MNTKILMLLVALLTMSVPIVQAGTPPGGPFNQVTPANIVVNYQINTVTTFVVNIVGTETQMNFSGNRDAKLVEPAGQVNASNISWATIENQGEVAQSFKVKLAALNTGTSIYASNFSTMSPQTTLTTTAVSPTGWTNVPACAQPCTPGTGAIVNLYAKASFTNAPAGTGTLTIST